MTKNELQKALATVSLYDIFDFKFEAKFLDSHKVQKAMVLFALGLGYVVPFVALFLALVI